MFLIFMFLNKMHLGHFQLELDKTAEAFRKSHAERQEVLHQWEATIQQMQKRDHEMDVAALVSEPAPAIQHFMTC